MALAAASVAVPGVAEPPRILGAQHVGPVLVDSERFASLPFDLADASIAEAAARLRIAAVLSIDSDFDVYRDRAGQPLANLLRR